MIAIMTSWLSKASRAVFFSVHYSKGAWSGNSCLPVYVSMYILVFASLPLTIHVCDDSSVTPCGIFRDTLRGSRPQECVLINLNSSFPNSAAPRKVINPRIWFKSSDCCFRQQRLLNAACQIMTNQNTDATCLHHKANKVELFVFVYTCVPQFSQLNSYDA